MVKYFICNDAVEDEYSRWEKKKRNQATGILRKSWGRHKRLGFLYGQFLNLKVVSLV